MLLGSWCMATEDIDRQVAIQAKRAWDLVFSSSLASGSAINLDADSLNLIINFIRRALFDPASIYAELNPVQPSIPQELPDHAAPRNKGGVPPALSRALWSSNCDGPPRSSRSFDGIGVPSGQRYFVGVSRS